MFIGNFNRYLQIEKPVVIKNSFGEEEITYELFLEVYADKYDKVSSIEKYEANQKVNIESSIFYIYFEEGINARMRIFEVDENKIYQITGIKEIGYKEGLQIFTEAKDNL